MRKAARKAAEAAARDQGLGQAMQLEVLGRKPRPPKRDESKYHKGSCDMKLIQNPDGEGAEQGEWARVQPGDFWWGVEEATADGKDYTYRIMWAKYPDGSFACLPINVPAPVMQAGIRGASWGFDGNLEKPTLTPSVHHVGHWHGWVRAGRMVSV